MHIPHDDINLTSDVLHPLVQALFARFENSVYETVYEAIMNAYVLDWLTQDEEAAVRPLFRGAARKRLLEFHSERSQRHAVYAAYHLHVTEELRFETDGKLLVKEEVTRPARVVRIRDSK